MPKKPKDVSSDEHINIRLPKQEKTSFIEAARNAGFDLTTWIRLVLRKTAGIDRR